MAGIRKVNNKVRIGGVDNPWGGSVVDLQYSISFEGTSSLTVTVANKTGNYGTPTLDAMNPLLIEFGSAKMHMLPVSYRKSKGAGGRTLRVDFEDMGLRYLDKNIVLLKDQHLNGPIGGCTIVLGKMFADDINGIEARYYGRWKSGLVRVKYDIRDLAAGIKGAGVPISNRLSEYLSTFRAYPPFSGNGSDPPSSFLRSDVGPLRDVLGSVSNELGFVFFWNNADGIDENFDTGTVFKGGAGAYSGFLDFVVFKDNIDTNIINHTINEAAKACNVEDDSYEVSIKDSYIKGGIGYFAVEPTFNVGGSNRFKRLKFQDTITSPYGGSVHAADFEAKMLMKAALVGAGFYARYVMQKLAAYYVQNMGDDLGIYDTLSERSQADPPGGGAEPFALVGKSILDEASSGEQWKINTTTNDAVTALYASEFVLLPCVYSKAYADEGGGVLSWRQSREFNDNLPPQAEEMGVDDRWILVFEDESFVEKLRPTSEFIGVAYVNNLSIRNFLENPDQCPIYQQAKFLAENYGKWYSLGGGALLVESAFTSRTYTEDVSWVFSDTAVIESPLADVFNSTWSKTDSEGNPETPDYEEAVYRMVLAGQSNCGNREMTPFDSESVIQPSKRVWSSEIGRLDGVIESYKYIIGIKSFLKGGANSTGGRTGCLGGAGDDEFISNIDKTTGGSIKGFVIESRQRRSNTNTDDIGGTDQGGVGGGSAKSLTQEGYGLLQEYRGSCTDPDKCPEATRSDGVGVCFSYPTDKDYGVVLHDASADVSTGHIQGDIVYSNYGVGNDVGQNDLWYHSKSAYFALEIVQLSLDATGAEENPATGPPEERSTQFGRAMVDWWDYQLDRQVTLASGAQRMAPSSKIIGYSYTVDFILQSLRAAYIPKSGPNFRKAGSIEVEEVEFQIGEVVKQDNDRFEFPLCDNTATDINFEEAAANLIKIMSNYVELNISEAISRDFVVSGYGFNKDGGVCPPSKFWLPTIHQGLESISMSLSGDSGVRTTIKIGNKRRKRASAQLRREMIVRGMPMARSRALIPNSVNNSFSVGVQTKI